MLLTITTTHQPARDLGYLLHKNPDNAQSFELPFGKAHVYYPEASDERCTMALLLEVDPIGLVRGRKGVTDDSFGLGQYVNDRPFAASSLLSVTFTKLFGTALSGNCKQRPELVDKIIPLEATVAVISSRGGEKFIRSLFEPLGYEVAVTGHALDPQYPEWGDERYFTVNLKHNLTLKDLLDHLYVLIPVLDGEKHYWVGDEEVEKLLKKGKGWLDTHPRKDVIAYRFLKKKRSLAKTAVNRLNDDENGADDDDESRPKDKETELEEKIYLNEQRLKEVLQVLKKEGVERVADLGCGEGKLLRMLLNHKQFTDIVGIDVSSRSLERAASKLHIHRLPERDAARIQLLLGSLMYRDNRIEGFDGIAVVEVIEHLDPPRLDAFQRVVFQCAAPRVLVITTPNVEYNVKFENLPPGKLRHSDHRFEWTRQEFQSWANSMAERYDYTVRFQSVGPEDEKLGAPSQMGVFIK